jgi:hypothetical protein
MATLMHYSFGQAIPGILGIFEYLRSAGMEPSLLSSSLRFKTCCIFTCGPGSFYTETLKHNTRIEKYMLNFGPH